MRCQLSPPLGKRLERRRHPFRDKRVQISAKRDAASGQTRAGEVPVWYRSDAVDGRLIGNRLASERRGDHWRGAVGALFLSTVPPVVDMRGVKLKHEVAQIAADVANRRLLAAPSS